MRAGVREKSLYNKKMYINLQRFFVMSTYKYGRKKREYTLKETIWGLLGLGAIVLVIGLIMGRCKKQEWSSYADLIRSTPDLPAGPLEGERYKVNGKFLATSPAILRGDNDVVVWGKLYVSVSYSTKEGRETQNGLAEDAIGGKPFSVEMYGKPVSVELEDKGLAVYDFMTAKVPLAREQKIDDSQVSIQQMPVSSIFEQRYKVRYGNLERSIVVKKQVEFGNVMGAKGHKYMIKQGDVVTIIGRYQNGALRSTAEEPLLIFLGTPEQAIQTLKSKADKLL